MRIQHQILVSTLLVLFLAGCGGSSEVDENGLTSDTTSTTTGSNGNQSSIADGDSDGVSASSDNCPDHPNNDQTDLDGDGIGDVCDIDDDGDTVTDATDNCPRTANPDQADVCNIAANADGDTDGVADHMDNCPGISNPNQNNVDSDANGDACDSDDDGDGVSDASDNCPVDANADQADADSDGQGDTCDTVNTTSADADSDGIADSQDNCPAEANSNQADNDNDGFGDLCDIDDDADGVSDTADNCPNTANTNQSDADNDGIGDACDPVNNTQAADSDNDGVADATDNCPTISNTNQTDTDSDDTGDACDSDDDGDGVADTADNCQFAANPTQSDGDNDGLGDACDTSVPDADSDGVADASDNCPAIANPNQNDLDSDNIGDVCDIDDDDDGVTDVLDNCPLIANSNQTDTDSDGVGDACDTNSSVDTDNDGIDDVNDNCATISNANQLDTDSDSMGDACDADDDNDTVLDAVDNCPINANQSQLDTDTDGMGDACDSITDSDDDGIADASDNCPSVANADQLDSDSNGTGDACESGSGGFAFDTNLVSWWPLDAGSGATAVDTQSGNDALVADASWNSSGISNGSMSFNSELGIETTASADFSLTDFSLSAWGNSSSCSGNSQTILSHDRNGNNWYSLKLDADCALEFRWGGWVGTNYDVSSSTGLADGNWHHFVGTYDSATQTAKIYVDGVLENTITNATVPTPADDDIRIGAQQSGWGQYSGMLDEIRIYNRSLTAAEVFELFDNPSGGGGAPVDTDDDGVNNNIDNCITIPNADQANFDQDAQGDVCDDDDDGDGAIDTSDNCLLLSNPSQADTDSDNVGNACDTDDDDDGVADLADNCPLLANPAQEDENSDGIGDACEFSCAGDDHLFVFMGQSNMQGSGGDNAFMEAPTPVSGTAYEYFLSSDSVEEMTTQNGEWLNYNGGNQLGAAKTSSLIPAFAVEYNALTGKKVTAVHAARGGASWVFAFDPSFGDWQPGNDLLNAAKVKIDAAITKTSLPVTGFVMLGGESDIAMGCGGEDDEFSIAGFKEGVRDILRELNTSYNAPVYFILPGHLNLDSSPWVPSCDWASDVTRQAIVELTAEVEFASYVKVVHDTAHTFRDSGNMYLNQDDWVHYNQTGLNKLGSESATNLVTNQLCN